MGSKWSENLIVKSSVVFVKTRTRKIFKDFLQNYSNFSKFVKEICNLHENGIAFDQHFIGMVYLGPREKLCGIWRRFFVRKS